MDREDSSSSPSALSILRGPVDDAGGKLSLAEAKQILIDSGYSETSADRTLQQLEDRGRIYVVDDCIRITPED